MKILHISESIKGGISTYLNELYKKRKYGPPTKEQFLEDDSDAEIHHREDSIEINEIIKIEAIYKSRGKLLLSENKKPKKRKNMGSDKILIFQSSNVVTFL